MSEVAYIVNAFTANSKNGNPAGVVLHANDLSEQQMLDIASEIGLSETAFVSRSNHATHKVRLFTPTTEEPLCGHATIATWSLLHELGELPAGTYTQETQAGLLEVSIREDGLVFMQQAKAEFFDEIAPADIKALLGLETSDFHVALHPQIVSTGIKDLLVPVRSRSVLAKIRPSFDAIAAFSRQHDISGLHVFALSDNRQSLASTRNFAPADGIPEECATGTSNGALLCYLKRAGLLPAQDIYRIEQGEAMGSLSYVYGEFKSGTVWVGGQAKLMGQRNIT